MTYTVYENYPNNKAIVHKSSCSYVKMHGGVSRKTPPTGRYYENIGTLTEAWRRARATGRRDVRSCKICSPV